MKVILNGDQKEIAEGITVYDLVMELGLKPERLAVEINRRIIRRSEWREATLVDGDRVEMVHFVGGGSPSPRERRLCLTRSL